MAVLPYTAVLYSTVQYCSPSIINTSKDKYMYLFIPTGGFHSIECKHIGQIIGNVQSKNPRQSPPYCGTVRVLY